MSIHDRVGNPSWEPPRTEHGGPRTGREGVEETKEKNWSSSHERPVWSPGTQLAGCTVLGKWLSPSDLHLLHLLNENNFLHKTEALKLERASESPGKWVIQSCPTLQPHELYVARQVPLSTWFSRQEYWNGLSFPSPGDLPDPGIEPRSPSLHADSLPSEPPRKPTWRTGLNTDPQAPPSLSQILTQSVWGEPPQICSPNKFPGGPDTAGLG